VSSVSGTPQPEQASENKAVLVIKLSRQNYAVEWKNIGIKANKSQPGQSPKEVSDYQSNSGYQDFGPQAKALDV